MSTRMLWTKIGLLCRELTIITNPVNYLKRLLTSFCALKSVAYEVIGCSCVQVYTGNVQIHTGSVQSHTGCVQVLPGHVFRLVHSVVDVNFGEICSNIKQKSVRKCILSRCIPPKWQVLLSKCPAIYRRDDGLSPRNVQLCTENVVDLPRICVQTEGDISYRNER